MNKQMRNAVDFCVGCFVVWLIGITVVYLMHHIPAW